jgi:hypothetical protein
MIAGVVVVGDLLRPDGAGQPGGTDRPTLWLWNAIKRQANRACGLPVEVLTTAGPIAAWIRSLRPPEQADPHWATNYAELPRSEPLERLLLQRLRGRFCIGYEIPPWLARLLDEAEVPYVDIRLHPIRFLDDLIFAVRASDARTRATLLDAAVHESEILATAGLREAMCRFVSEAALPDGTLLVAGQRRFDATQIVAGEFFDALPRTSEIHAICNQYQAVVLKPHPLDPRHTLLEVAAGVPGRVIGVINDNVYRLMSLPQVTGILTVNSGVAYEAPYFGKRVHMLAPPTMRVGWRGDTATAGVHASIGDAVLTPDFWRLVLAPHAAVTPADGIRLPVKPNRLRIALDSFWNYQEIDTDRIPRPPGS